MDNLYFLRKAIENSQQSMNEGNFPAGAVVVRKNELIASAVSSPFPNLLHSDSKAIVQAFEKIGPLNDCTLYIGIESCLMCSSIAYWSGLRRIVYAIPAEKVSQNYYVTDNDTELLNHFHAKIESIHRKELENEALVIVRAWESKNSRI